jgi:general secretion pathway protein D
MQGGITPPGAQPQAATPGGGSFSDRLQNIIRRASVSGEIQILGQTKIIADERTNSLLIFASKPDLKTIKDIVAKLDVVLAQVLIEAVIIEVQLGPDTKEFGVSYLQHPKSAGDFTGVGAGGAGNFFNPGSFIGLGTNTGGALKGGFNYFGQWNNDLEVSVTAITSDTRAKILQRPRIQTSHAVQAQLFVGQSRPYPTASYYGGGSFGGYSSIQQLQIGVTLDVTPLINPDGLVVMDIHQTIESYNGDVDIANVGKVPITSRKEAAAKVAVRDRDTIILGGLIEDDKNKSKSGIPLLMDIPVLGYLFRTSSSSQTRSELIVLLRPTVLPTPEIAALTARSEKDKMPGVKQTEKEILEEEAKRLKEVYRQEKRIY